jgi:hypothetical protein
MGDVISQTYCDPEINEPFECGASKPSNEQCVVQIGLLLNSEFMRLRTFRKWKNTKIDKHALAQLGFIYLNKSDKVQCISCLNVFEGWANKFENPMEEHMKRNPNCRAFPKE